MAPSDAAVQILASVYSKRSLFLMIGKESALDMWFARTTWLGCKLEKILFDFINVEV
jgi:hypothetical protein